MKKEQVAYNFVLSGFVIGVVLVIMFAGFFVVFAGDVQDKLNLTGNITLDKYNKTKEIIQLSEEIKNSSTSIKQQTGILDVIGGFFSNGYTALKISIKSFDIFDDMMDDASQDVEGFAFYKQMFMVIIIIALFLGVLIAAIVKWVI